MQFNANSLEILHEMDAFLRKHELSTGYVSQKLNLRVNDDKQTNCAERTQENMWRQPQSSSATFCWVTLGKSTHFLDHLYSATTNFATGDHWRLFQHQNSFIFLHTNYTQAWLRRRIVKHKNKQNSKE